MGEKIEIERQTEMGREGELSEGQWGQGRKHMRRVLREGDTMERERGGTTNLISTWETQNHRKNGTQNLSYPSTLTGSLNPSLCSFPKPQAGHYSQGSEAALWWDLQHLLSCSPIPSATTRIGLLLPPHQAAGAAQGLPEPPQHTPKQGLTEDRVSTRLRTQAALPPCLGEAWGKSSVWPPKHSHLLRRAKASTQQDHDSPGPSTQNTCFNAADLVRSLNSPFQPPSAPEKQIKWMKRSDHFTSEYKHRSSCKTAAVLRACLHGAFSIQRGEKSQFLKTRAKASKLS